MCIKKDRPIIQDSERFAELLQKLVRSTKIKHFCNKAIGNFKKTNPFKTSVSVTGMFNMHGAVDGSKTQLWRNSAYRKMVVKVYINIERNKHKRSDNYEMQL